MTGSEILFLSGLILAFEKVATILIARAFCTKPIPQWVRLWQEFALALFGVRLIAFHVWDLGPGVFSTAVIVHIAAVGFVVFALNWRRAFVHRDRCVPRTG